MPVATAVVSSLLAAVSVSTAAVASVSPTVATLTATIFSTVTAVTTVTSTTVTSITRSFGLLRITTIAFGAEGEVRILAFGAGPIATAIASISAAAVVSTLIALATTLMSSATITTSATVTSITRSFGLLRITTIAFGAEGEVRILAFGAGPIATAIASISAAAVVSTLIALATTLMSSAAIASSATITTSGVITSSTIVPLIATAISTVTTLVTTSAVISLPTLVRCDFDRRADSARRIDLGIQRMNVNQRSVDRSYDRVHTAQRSSANHANHRTKARCTPLEGNQKPTFVRLLLDVAGETHVLNPRRPEYMRATDAARSSPGSPIAGSENPGLPFTVGSGSTGSGSSKR